MGGAQFGRDHLPLGGGGKAAATTLLEVFFPPRKFPLVLVPSGFYNKIPQARWLRNTKNIFLLVLEAGESKIKALAD